MAQRDLGRRLREGHRRAAQASRELLRDAEGLIARLPAALGLAPEETEEEIERRIVHGGIACSEWAAIAETLGCGGPNDRKAAEKLKSAARHAPGRACIEPYSSLFFTDKGGLRAAVATGAVEKIAPGLPARLKQEGERLAALQDKRAAAGTRARSGALIALAADIFERYQRDQARPLAARFRRSDRDDARRLLMRRPARAVWVRYKLDGGIDHILVDEAQDTSEAQWDILRALASEFSAGAGARAAHRTFFAVGDEKQSIFSFQGAAPAEFDRMRRAFREGRVRCGRTGIREGGPSTCRSARRVWFSRAVDHVFRAETPRAA